MVIGVSAGDISTAMMDLLVTNFGPKTRYRVMLHSRGALLRRFLAGTGCASSRYDRSVTACSGRREDDAAAALPGWLKSLSTFHAHCPSRQHFRAGGYRRWRFECPC